MSDAALEQASCRCNFCNGDLAFPASDNGSLTICPHCGMETRLYVVQQEGLPEPLRRPRNRRPALVIGIVIVLVAAPLILYLAVALGPLKGAIGSALAAAGALLVLGAAGALYFLPSLIAAAAKKTNLLAIFALNLLLGWTFLGWVVALVWALTKDSKP